MLKTIEIIKSEHRRMAAMLDCLSVLLEDVEKGKTRPDFGLFDAILNYIESFLYRFHHPKENKHLFRLLRKRAAEIGDVLDEMEAQREQGAEFAKRLRESLDDYKKQGNVGLKPFAEAAAVYGKFEWQHTGVEEKQVLPTARERLTDDDKAELDAVFTAHQDPVFGDARREEFERLYTEILNRTPAPHGLGPGIEGS